MHTLLLETLGGVDGRLLAACHCGDAEAARAAIAAGADVEACDESAWTLFGALWHCWRPLHWAACAGHVGVASLLLDAGAESEPRSGDGTTPLKAAAAKGRASVVRLLLAPAEWTQCVPRAKPASSR